MSVTPRMGRLFAADGKCFNVAIDHGFFGEHGFLTGIEDMRRAVRTVVDAAPDVIQLTPGQARHLVEIPGPRKPALALRTDTANVYGKQLPRTLFAHLIDDAVGTALRLDAACVVVNLLMLPDEPEVHRQCVANVARLKPACERFGMPLMVEPLVMQSNTKAGGYMVDGTIEKILALVRQAVELGADVIKADPCDDPSAYHRVVEIASGVPVLVRGGGRVSDDEILKRTAVLMQQGAAGIVYGRNVIQHAHPARMTRALMAVVHDGATAAEAARLLAD
ncbi:MAG TPA: aldolase [Planctomycetota bacterium]|nr:aldolase [Planctomycetota bacterium]